MQKKTGILQILSASARYIKRKVRTIYEKLVKKRTKKTDNGENLKRKLIDELRDC